MKIRDINKPINSKTLNETLAKQFGTKLNVDSFTLEQLQDARNKVRTMISQIETNESFSGLPKNETYAKNKLFLDVLNAAISERADVDEALEEKKHNKRPDSPDLDGDGDTEEPIAQAAKDAKKKKTNEETRDEKKARYKQARADKRIGDKMDKDAEITSPAMKKKKKVQNDLLKMAGINNESIVSEGEEDKAELVMASKDMVDRLTGWMEDTAEMQSESTLELADAIRDEMGQQESDAFVNTVKPALEQLYASMETTREALTAGVGQLTGEGEAPAMDMGEPMDMEAPMDDPVGDEAEMEPVEDDGMATAPAAVGGEDEAGRARRESRYHKKKAMLETSRRLGTILSKKK